MFKQRIKVIYSRFNQFEVASENKVLWQRFVLLNKLFSVKTKYNICLLAVEVNNEAKSVKNCINNVSY